MISIYSLALAKTYGIGPAVAKKLLEHYPTAEDLFNETPNALKIVFGTREKTINAILNKTMFADCERELNFIINNNIKAYFLKDENYPYRLKQIADPPICLFVRGNGDLDSQRTVAIVGTRTPSDYGKWVTANVVHYLRQYNVTTISGLAYGVDSTRSSFIGLFLQLALLAFYGIFYKIKSRKLSIIFKHSRLYFYLFY